MASGVVCKAILLAVAVHCVAGDPVCSYACPYNYAPVCGSDGITYPNECSLSSEMKCKNSDLRMEYEGECGSAEKCLPHMKTGACTREYMPVCGSDGKSYGNMCTFCYARYQILDQGADLRIAHSGECIEPQPEDIDECPESSKQGVCTYEYRPVCANNDETFPTKCVMCATMYDMQRKGINMHLHVVHEGKCKTSSVAAEIPECSPREKSGACTFEYMPVCDSNGKTHANKCMFCYALDQAEAEGKQLSIQYRGECNEAQKSNEVDCLPREKLGLCTKEYNPVCGSNGKTYANKCTFCYALAQAEDQQLTVAHHGSCEEIERARAARVPTCYPRMKYGACTKELSPVCGTNGQTYANECLLCYAMYQLEEAGAGEKLAIEHDGSC